jgi:glycosyltransferase involved in cell wall biosynthesis
VGGLSEYILENETGFLVSSGNSQELADALDKCITNLNNLPKLPALNKLKSKLSWGSLVEAFLAT